MAAGVKTVAMLFKFVGVQLFNNWNKGRQNEELQKKREEFDRAVCNHQADRMREIMREGQKMTLSLEESKHKQRVEELKCEVEQLLQSIAYQKTIENWPMNVLPVVMKNQALGNILAHQEESFAIHCILTPSNCTLFNEQVFPHIEMAMEDYCNQHWSAISSHPVFFYSGAWKSKEAPSQTQIVSMQVALGNLPTMLITPFFRPNGKLVFQLRIWGVGITSDNSMFDQTTEIEPVEFAHDYITTSDYDNEDRLLEDAIGDIVPYLQCLIGYMVDTYFWSASGLKPRLPVLLKEGVINIGNTKHLLTDSLQYYGQLLEAGKKSLAVQPFSQKSVFNLYEGYAEIADSQKKEELYKELKDSVPYIVCDEKKEEESIDNDRSDEIDMNQHIYCRNPQCGSLRCYLVKGAGYYRCVDCGWEGIKVII